MRFIRLQLANFLSYESLDLDLTQITYTSVTGENGSGKSTVPLALAWALYGTTRVSSISTSIIRDESDYAEVTLDLEDESGTFWRIYRHLPMRGSQTLRVYESADGEDWAQHGDHLVATAREKIAELVGMSENAFYSLMLVDQSSTAGGTRFTRSDANTRREILHGLIPELERWSEYHGKVSEISRRLNKKVTQEEGKLDSFKETLSAHKEQSSTLQSEIDDFGETLDSLAEERKGCEQRVSKITQEIGQTSSRIKDMENKQNAVKAESRAKIAELKSELTNVEHDRSRIASTTNSLSSAISKAERAEQELADAESSVPKLNGDEQDRIVSLESDRARIDEKIEKAREEVAEHRSEIQRNEKQIARLVEAEHELEDGRCPVCNSELTEAQCQSISENLRESNTTLDEKLLAAKEKIDNLTEKRSQIETSLSEIKRLISDNDLAQARIEAKRESVAKAKDDVKEWKTAVADLPDESELDAREKKIKSKISKEKESRDKKVLEIVEQASIEDDEEAVAKLRKKLSAVEQNLRANREDTDELQELHTRLQSAKDSAKETKKRIKETKKGLEELEVRQQSVGWLYKALSTRGAPAMLLDSVLGAIEEAQNEILQRLSVGIPMQVEFRQTRPNKSNDGVKEVLDIIVHTGSGIERPIEAFSFGERVLLSLSNVFAMVQVFNRMHPGIVRTIFLDEPLGSLDDIRVPAFVDVIQTVMEAGIVDAMWIITHDQKVVSALPQQVMVSKNEVGNSELELVV